MRHRVVLAAAGSLGDLHPFIALGLALQSLGLQAEIASSAEYRSKVEAAGLVFHEVGPSLAQLETDLNMTLAEITEAIISSDVFLFRRILLPYLEASVTQMTAVAGGASAIVGATLTVGAGMAAEKLDVPYVSVMLQPALLFSAFDPPALPKAPWLAPATKGLGLVRNRATFALARLTTAGLKRPRNLVRARLSLPATNDDVVFDPGCGAALSLGLYSPLLGLAPPDAPPGFTVTGYAAYDSETGGPTSLSPALEAFLAAGPAPIVFTLGSAAVNIPGKFYDESLETARRLGRRSVLLVGPEGDLAVADGPDVITVPYAPFSTLFPRAAAIVHQGGVGTTQQALRAGKLQLVVPHLGDQYDNAARVVRLGCGATLSRRRYRAERIAGVLGGLLTDPRAAETATRLGIVASREDGAAEAADRIMGLIG